MKPQQSFDAQKFVDTLLADVSNVCEIDCKFSLFHVSTYLTQVNGVNQTIFYAVGPNIAGFTFSGQTQGQTNGNSSVQLSVDVSSGGSPAGNITLSIQSDPNACQSTAKIGGIIGATPIQYNGVIADWAQLG